MVIISIPLLLALVLWLGPRLPALYHQEQGARLLARALMAEGRGGEGGLWLEPEPLTRPEARSLATQALAHFEAAVAADPGNFQAHRWLGRAALLIDRPEEAIVAFSAAARLRPANPLAWWHLGLAYERLAPAPVFPESGDMNVPALAPDSRPVIPDKTGAKPALIPAISVEVPPMGIPDSNRTATDYPLSPTGYIQWRMPDAPDAWPGWWVPPEPVRRTVLFAAVPATLTFQFPLPVTPTVLIFWMGMDLLRQPPRGDGVVYRVWVENIEVFSHTLRPEDALEGWWPAQVDLTPWAGRMIRLTLTLDPGPAGDTTGDWAGWGDLQLVPANTARCWLASCRERAAAAWRKGDFTAQDFIQAGEVARRAQRYEEALRWYGRAARMNGKPLDTVPEDLQNHPLLVLESFATTEAWYPCSWCNNTEGLFEIRDGVLEMSCRNILNKRQGFGFLFRPHFTLNGLGHLLLRVKGEPGTLLTIEIVVDGKRSRPLNYQPVPVDWEVYSIPLEGKTLDEILVGIGEPEPLSASEEYRLFIDWIALQ